MRTIPSTRHRWAIYLLTTSVFLLASPAHAVPSYARQTGQNCIACHVSFPELTPYGRYFKLSGYTLGERQLVPLAAMAQGSYTKIKNNSIDDGSGTGATTNAIEHNGEAVFTGASVFLAGKATDYLGGFLQWTYDGIAHHSNIDNTDFRLVGRYVGAGSQEPDLIYGLTLHNNPTVQDVWNSTPAFGFPFTSSPVAATPSTPSALVDGTLAQQATGLGGYLYWQKSWYAELTFYRASTGVFSALKAGDIAAATRLKGYNPYWRFAWNREWGAHSLELGTFGMQGRVLLDPTDTDSGTDRFRDTALDAQYQYITDPHTFTAQASWIHEKQSRDASFAAGDAANDSNTLRTTRLKGTYYYQRTYGATLAYATTTGSADALLYPAGTPGAGFDTSSVPDSASWTLELNYAPIQNVHLMLQYVSYQKFNGAKTNYDGFGRNASDNNTLFFNVWIAY